VVTARNDFGLLHLEDDFVLSETIDTICLPKSPNTGKEFLDDCYAAGWGKDSNGNHLYTLYSLSVPGGYIYPHCIIRKSRPRYPYKRKVSLLVFIKKASLSVQIKM